jgi:RNAse (barnase) inhibitor barstar
MSILQVIQQDDVVLETSQNLKDILSDLRYNNYFAVLVDRAPVYNKDTLLHAIYQSCVLPAYFGFNWDALVDTLIDFSWLDTGEQEVKGYVLVFRNFSVLEKRSEVVAKTFMDIIQDVAQRRQEKNRPPLKVVLIKEQEV